MFRMCQECGARPGRQALLMDAGGGGRRLAVICDECRTGVAQTRGVDALHEMRLHRTGGDEAEVPEVPCGAADTETGNEESGEG